MKTKQYWRISVKGSIVNHVHVNGQPNQKADLKKYYQEKYKTESVNILDPLEPGPVPNLYIKHWSN